MNDARTFKSQSVVEHQKLEFCHNWRIVGPEVEQKTENSFVIAEQDLK